MAFLVLAVGAVMFVAGAAEMFYGNGMIEIERGWSAFIAGSILLAGGVLTMALGVAVRALGQVRLVLLQLGGLADGLPAPTRAEIAVPLREPVSLRDAEPAMQLENAGLQIEPHFGGAPGAAIEAAEMPPLRLRDEVAPPPAMASPEPPVEAEAAMDEWFDRDAAVDIPAPHRQRDEAPLTRPSRLPAVAEVIEADASAEAARGDRSETADRSHAEAGPSIGRAGIASEAPSAATPSSPPAAPPAAPAAPAAPAPAPAVIGRYEADGTSYVMFADGSIEAQSEAGVYRFASMAELKSFIET